jgi:hypothetical protein
MGGPDVQRRGLGPVLGLAVALLGCGGSLKLPNGETTLRAARGGNGTILLGTAPGMGRDVEGAQPHASAPASSETITLEA